MSQTEQYDAILIGAGQANGPLATTLARAGWEVALIEQKHVGGTCINEGCTPTKTMIASARVAHLARRAADYGVHTGPVTLDMEKVRQRKRDIVTSFRAGSRRRVENTEGVDLLMGQARFTGPKTVKVALNQGGIRHLTADNIFINVGQRPRKPDLPGLDGVPYFDSTSIMELGEVPEHLMVVGGGYVGVEFGQMFRRFGSQVTIVQRSGQLLSREDADVAEEVAKILREDGIDVLLDTDTVQVEQDAGGQILLTVSAPDGERTLAGSHLLLAAGRVPNVEHLDLDVAGIETTTRGDIKVNERLETNVPGIYALGDVKGGPAFTHIAYDDFRIVRTNILEGGDATTENRLVPYTVFIDPQLGGIGLTEKQARRRGVEIKIAKMPMSYVARALEVDEPRGMMKAIVDADTDQIVGAAILGMEGGEVVSALQLAMMGDVPYTVLRDAVFAHPTLIESLNNLFATLE
ncbi:MAG: mercuric reductase [Anaerolineae bacterium]|jgi:pyruvate/2-oxoglutarate dehydrogenase complex dihydrolipoamide dehydrogenase (E3) component